MDLFPAEHAHNQPALPLSRCLVLVSLYMAIPCAYVCVQTPMHAWMDQRMHRLFFKDNSFNKVFTPYLKQVFMKKMHKIPTDRNYS